MQELIKISVDEQGLSVVSARDLYSFLGVKKQFADWIKNRIDKYGLQEGQDYTTFSLIGEKGRPTLEYALTLDAAKELAMVEGNAKGKEARQYFITAEKNLRQLTNHTPLTTEQMLVQLASQQAKLLTNQQEQLNQLRADVEMIMTTGHRPAPMRPPVGKQLGLPGIPQPTAIRPMRQVIASRVNDYSGRFGVTAQETYTYLYRRLFDVYGINTYRLQRIGNESILDALERYGHLDRLYSLVMAELSYVEE